MPLTKNSMISVIMLTALLFISLLFYFLLPRSSDSYILYFPHSITNQVHGELRLAPRRDSFEAKAELIIEESLLGTKDIQLTNLVPQGKYLESIFVRDNYDVYVNFDPAIQKIVIDNPSALDEVFYYLELSLRRNLALMGELHFLIGGQELWKTIYKPDVKVEE